MLSGFEYLMNDIPHFAEAFEQFRQFLARSGHSDQVFWVFRDDVLQVSPGDLRVKYPPSAENAALAQKVFAEGRARGLIEITAIANAGKKVAATVWFPKYPNEEVQGWTVGMKLTISEPLPSAKVVGRLRWCFFTFLPHYRRFQDEAFFIGTRKWAVA